MLDFIKNSKQFDDIRLIESKKETISGANVYKVIDVDGNVDITRSVDVAHYISKYANYNNIVLNYDMLSGTLECQIIVYSGTQTTKNISTSFNNSTIASNFLELV